MQKNPTWLIAHLHLGRGGLCREVLPKKCPFIGWRYMKVLDFCELKYSRGQEQLSFGYFYIKRDYILYT